MRARPASSSVSITRYLVTLVTRAGIRHHRPVSVSRMKITPTTAQVRREAPVFVPLCRAQSIDLRRGSGAGSETPDCACSEASGDSDHSPLPQRFPPLVMPADPSPGQPGPKRRHYWEPLSSAKVFPRRVRTLGNCRCRNIFVYQNRVAMVLSSTRRFVNKTDGLLKGGIWQNR